MAAQCPNKSRNPFCEAAAIVSDSESTPSLGASSEHHQHRHGCCGNAAPAGKALASSRMMALLLAVLKASFLLLLSPLLSFVCRVCPM